MLTLHIQLPEGILTKDPTELETLAQEALVVRLYDLGELSSGEAADLLQLSRREFLDLVGTYGVSIFDDTQQVVREAAFGDQ